MEYGPPTPVLRDAAEQLEQPIAILRDQVNAAGSRIATILRLDSNPLTTSGFDVSATDVAGLLRIAPRFELEVAPKFLGTTWSAWREDFFFIAMLSRHGRLLASERLGATTARRGDLATLVARAIISMFQDNQRRPLRTYRHAALTEFAIDGDVDPESLILPAVEGYEQRVVAYDRRNVFNGTILGAATALLAEVREPQTRRQLTRVIQTLAPQPATRQPRDRIVPSRAVRWQPLHDLAVDVLGGFGIAYDPGAARAPGYVVDTWRVWQDLVDVGLRLAFGSQHVASQHPIALGVRRVPGDDGKSVTRTAWVKPDAFIRDRDGLLVDAKYKGRLHKAARISEEDLYEALAFATAGKKRRVVLVYPAAASAAPPLDPGTSAVFETVTVESVEVVGILTEVRGISRVGGLSRFATGLRDALMPLTERAAA